MDVHFVPWQTMKKGFPRHQLVRDYVDCGGYMQDPHLIRELITYWRYYNKIRIDKCPQKTGKPQVDESPHEYLYVKSFSEVLEVLVNAKSETLEQSDMDIVYFIEKVLMLERAAIQEINHTIAPH